MPLVREVHDYRTALAEWPRDRSPTLVVAADREPMWIGPVIADAPGFACPDCLARRLEENAPPPGREWGPWVVPAENRTAASGPDTPVAADGHIRRYLAALAADPGQARRLWTVYPDACHRHWAPNDASCARCGDPSWRQRRLSRPPQWVPTQKLQPTHRVRDADDSWRMLRRQVSPVTGVVTNLAGGGDGPLAGWGARHRAPHASADGSRVPVVRTGGKGVDSASARVAAVCEAVERTALTWPTDVPVTGASLTDLGDDALDPREVMLFSPRQYAAARSRPATSDELPPARADDEPGQTVDDAVIRHRVPVPLRDDDVLDWVPAFPLDGGRAAWVPAALVWFGHRGDGADPHFDSARIVADSNGVAAGATAAEAAVYGLLEVIERDAVAMWWHLRLHRPTVDPDTCDDAYLQGFQAHVTATGRTFWLLDITNDIDVPVFVAVTARADGSEVVFGFGAHLDRVAAARSAVTECAQFLVAFDRNPTDRHGLFGEPGRAWWGTQTLDTDPHLRASGSALWPRDQSGPRDTDDLATLHDRLTAAGLRAYAVDMSRPDVPELTVMRMIVPGARSMFPRFAEGRLFDVPHRLGWTPQRLTEADVNPEEIFF